MSVRDLKFMRLGFAIGGCVQLVLFLVSLPLMLVLIGFPMLAAVWLWVVIDGVVLLLGGGRDGRGRPLRP